MDKNWLNYHHLYYFTIIAQEGAIAKAAKRLRLGQPTLSTQLKQFEEHLGIELFERKKKRLYLTEAGRVALDYANEIFRLGSEMVDTLNDRRHSDRMEIQIGCMDSVPKDYVLRLIQALQSYNSCHVTCVEGSSDHLMEQLRAHKLDLLLTHHPIHAEKNDGIHSRKIGSSPVSFYADKRYLKLAKGFPESLSGQPFILSNHNLGLRQALEYHFKRLGLTMDVIADVQDTSLQKLMATSGLGIIPLADSAAQVSVSAKELIKLGSFAEVQEEVWMVVADRRIQNPLAMRLMGEFHLPGAE